MPLQWNGPATESASPGDIRWCVRSTGNSSHKYGPCQVCGEHAAEVFSLNRQIRIPAWAGAPEEFPASWAWLAPYRLGHERCVSGLVANPEEAVLQYQQEVVALEGVV